MNTHANTSQSSCSQESLLIWSLSAGAGINKSKARNSRVLCSEPGASLSLSLALSLTHPLSECVCVCVPARVCVHACESKRPHWQCWTHLTIIWCSGPEAGVENDLDCPGPQHQQHREQKKKKKIFFINLFFYSFHWAPHTMTSLVVGLSKNVHNVLSNVYCN